MLLKILISHLKLLQKQKAAHLNREQLFSFHYPLDMFTVSKQYFLNILRMT